MRCLVKGAPDVLLARSAHVRDADGSTVPADAARDRVLAENDRLAGGGPPRARGRLARPRPGGFRPDRPLLDEVQGLTLLALVGIVDPPRKEARDAIAHCKEAGIRAGMITGDHATTAAAIAAQLGIEGGALTGTEFAALTDEELDRQLDEIGVVARVAPEDKVRLVERLKSVGNAGRDDRRRGQRRACAQARRHRCRNRDHRHRGHEGSRGHDPHRRQLRDDRARQSRAGGGSTTT